MTGPCFRGWPVDTANPLNRDNALNQGLAAWWLAVPWLHGGPTFYDLAGAYNGTLQGAASWAPSGPHGRGGSVAFDGTTGFVSAGAVVAALPVTLAAWFYTADNSLNQTIIEVGAVGQTNSHARLFITPATNGVRLNTIDSAGTQATADSAPLANNVWHHAAGVLFSSGAGFLYIDGMQVSAISAASFNPFTCAAIGALRWSTDIQLLKGGVSDARVYNRTLSASEIAGLYAESLAGYPGVLNRLNPATFLMMPGGTPTYTGTGTPALAALTPSATVSYTNPAYPGSGTPALSVLTATASVSYTPPVSSGSGVVSLSALAPSATVSYSDPAPARAYNPFSGLVGSFLVKGGVS